MRYATILMLGLLLISCVPEEGGAPELHDISLYNFDGNYVYGYFYGEAITLGSGERTLVLTKGAVDDPFAVSNALLVNGEPYLKQKILPLNDQPFVVQRVPLSTDLTVRTGAALEELVYFDGARWFTLLENAEPGLDARVVPRARLGGLRGLANLTSEEAKMLEQVFAEYNSLAVGVLAENPGQPRQVSGLEDYLRSALVVQTDVPTDSTISSEPVRELTWSVLAQGNQAVTSETSEFAIATGREELVGLWNKAYGNQLNLPPLPNLDFRRESVVAFFLGTRSTGGYSIDVQNVTLEGSEVFIDVEVNAPPPGAITTQALTSPWVMVRVPRGDIDVAWFRNPATGELFGVARGTR